MIDIRQFRYFVALAETMHFGRAAERLHLSQPPLSRQIAALEKALDVRLLDRNTRRVKLTQAGERFLQDAKAAIDLFDQACRNAVLAEQGELGELRIGFMMHAAFTVVPTLAKRFKSLHPNVKIHLREIIPSMLIDEILSGRIDAGIMFRPPRTKGIEAQVIHSENMCLALPAGHPLTKRIKISPASLRGETLIAAPEYVSPSLRKAILDWLRPGGFEPDFELEAQQQQTIISLVAESLGVALVPESMKKLGMSGVEYRHLIHPPIIEHAIVWKSRDANPSLPLLLQVSSKSFPSKRV